MAINGLNSIFKASSTVLEAVKIYSNVNILTTELPTTLPWFRLQISADVAGFMTHKDTILATFGRAADSTFHLRPGVEVQSSGNLIIDSDWNFYSATRRGRTGATDAARFRRSHR